MANTPEGNDTLNDFFTVMGVEMRLVEQSIQDPYIESAHKKAREYNELFQTEIVTVDDALQIQHELDTSWYELDGETVKVSGRVVVPKGKLKGEYSVADVEAISYGFAVRGDESDEDSEIIKNPTLQHVLRIGKGALDATLEGAAANKKVKAYAKIDAVHIEPGAISAERATAWLETSYPDLFEELNVRIFNAKGDEGASLLGLKGLNIAEFAPVDDDFTRECIEVYIRNLIDIDTGAFYSVGLEGPYKIKYGEASATTLPFKDGVLSYIYGPYIECVIEDDVVDRWGMVVELGVLTPEKNEPTVVIRTSLDSIKHAQSIRQAYYSV